MQKYKCGMCDSECALPSHCERHMTAAHSGFNHLCSSCSLVFARKDSKHECKNYSLQIVKRSSRTFTGRKPLSSRISRNPDQNFASHSWNPYHPAITVYSINQPTKRAILTEPLIPKKEEEIFSKTSDPCPYGIRTFNIKYSYCNIISGR